VDRSGSGPVAEVYPAASLHSWGLTCSSSISGMKRRGWTVRRTNRLCAGHANSSMPSSPRWRLALRPWARRFRPQGITWQPPQLRAGSSSPISRSARCC